MDNENVGQGHTVLFAYLFSLHCIIGNYLLVIDFVTKVSKVDGFFKDGFSYFLFQIALLLVAKVYIQRIMIGIQYSPSEPQVRVHFPG